MRHSTSKLSPAAALIVPLAQGRHDDLLGLVDGVVRCDDINRVGVQTQLHRFEVDDSVGEHGGTGGEEICPLRLGEVSGTQACFQHSVFDGHHPCRGEPQSSLRGAGDDLVGLVLVDGLPQVLRLGLQLFLCSPGRSSLTSSFSSSK